MVLAAPLPKCFPSTLERTAGIPDSPGLMSAFEKQPFHDRLMWTVGSTVKVYRAAFSNLSGVVKTEHRVSGKYAVYARQQ